MQFVQNDEVPICLEQFGADGWFFVSCEEIPGLSAFGPDLEDVFDRFEIAATELLRARGEKVRAVKVVTHAKVPAEASWGPVSKFALRTAA